MSPKSREQNEKIRQEKRRLILDKALEIFALRGYHESSVSLIAKHAGIAKGLMYDYFPSKEELLKSVVSEGFKDFFEIFPQNAYQVFSQNLDTPDIFRNLINKVISLIKGNIDFWRLYMAVALQPGVAEIILKDYDEFIFNQLNLLEKYYERAGSSDPRQDAVHANILIDGVILNYIYRYNEYTNEELEQLIIRLEKPVY